MDERNLWPGIPGLRFNPSIIEWPQKGIYVFVARNGWKGSDIYAGFLNSEFKPVGEPKKLELNHSDASYGREDPRLFIYKGQLHISYTGVIGSSGKRVWHTNVLYARLGADFKVEAIYHPNIPKRHEWEKNHGYFEYEGELYAVYSIRPHRIIKVSGSIVEWQEGSSYLPWGGGEPRGGASPIRVGDEFWSFFHDRIETGGHRIYRTGLYTFSTKPPFQPLRVIPRPILVANVQTKPSDQYASVVFVGGVVRLQRTKTDFFDGDDWILAHGVHDRWSELHKFSHKWLEENLKVVYAR